ncbi:MAG: Na/Pi cotransporter family protein [Acidobacteriota bacterium]
MGELELGTLVIGLLGGLAFFLYGMEMMTGALKVLAGERMKDLLARMTSNRFKAVFAGAAITATIQSSSVTTVLVVGFISAGLLSLSQSIGIIMGAEIGTTITAQIIAFKVTKYSLILVASGFFLSFVPRSATTRRWGTMVMGLGMIFFGMELMKEATSPLREFAPFIETMQNLSNPLLAVLFSATFTALVQSSSATTGVIIVLASQGFLTLEAGIALVFGANIGTCITAFLASIGKPREAVRAAVVHVLFNTAGVLLWISFIDELAQLIRVVSPVAEGLTGVEALKAETPRQIANAHTTFNVANTLIFLGFTPLIARIVEWVVPDRPLAEAQTVEKRYLDDLLVHTPALALDLVRMELARLGSAALAVVRQAIDPVLSGSRDDLTQLRDMDEEVDRLHAALVTYLGRLSTENLTEAQSHVLSRRLTTANHFEAIGDMIETNLVDAGMARLDGAVEISPSTREILRSLHEKVQWAVATATEAAASEDRARARAVIAAKGEINQLVTQAEGHLAERLSAPAPHRLAAFRIETELVEALKRIYYFAKRIARLVDIGDSTAPQGSVPAANDAWLRPDEEG